MVWTNLGLARCWDCMDVSVCTIGYVWKREGQGWMLTNHVIISSAEHEHEIFSHCLELAMAWSQFNYELQTRDSTICFLFPAVFYTVLKAVCLQRVMQACGTRQVIQWYKEILEMLG